MRHLTVRHTTTYRYAEPVRFGQHRLMIRPRDSHDLRMVNAEIALSPPGNLRWLHDVFGNSVALVDFVATAPELTIVSTLHLERYALARPDFVVEQDAAQYPFVYSAADRTDLGRLLERHHPDPGNSVDEWARSFVLERPTDTLGLLMRMNAAIRSDFAYNARYEEGTQAPAYTLETRAGTCRDFALLFIEAVRSLGFAARFVTGYLYDPALERQSAGAGGADVIGAGATHAWADVYLPGPGWVEFDPTNGLVAAENLIRVAVTRDPAQAVPVSGTYEGRADAFLGMDVAVEVLSRADPPL